MKFMITIALMFLVCYSGFPYVGSMEPKWGDARAGSICVNQGITIYHLGDLGKEKVEINDFLGFKFGERLDVHRPGFKGPFQCTIGLGPFFRSPPKGRGTKGKLANPFGRFSNVTCFYSGDSDRLCSIELACPIISYSRQEMKRELLGYKDALEKSYGVQLQPFGSDFGTELYSTNITAWGFSNENCALMVGLQSGQSSEQYFLRLCMFNYQIPREDYMRAMVAHGGKQVGKITPMNIADDHSNDIVVILQKELEALRIENMELKKKISNLESATKNGLSGSVTR